MKMRIYDEASSVFRSNDVDLFHGFGLKHNQIIDDNDPCYEKLSQIYPNTIECKKLSKLPQQVLEIIGKEIRK